MLRSPIPAGVDRYRRAWLGGIGLAAAPYRTPLLLIGALCLAAGAVSLARQQITASRCGPDGVCTPRRCGSSRSSGCSSASFCSISAIAMSDPVIELRSTLTCPHCGHQATETMPTNACQFFYDCIGCGTVLRPRSGDCCVFCSYGTVPCPPIQVDGKDGACCG
jgi:hypothetical protein